MPSSSSEAAPFGSEGARWLTLLALCLVVLFVGLDARALWNQDEGMHAVTSKVMVESGDWITPRFNGENFYDKPVLFTWMVAASFSLFGFSEWAARLPAAICGLIGVLATYGLGRRLFGSTAALFGAVVLVTSGGWVLHSRTVVHDISLVAAVVLALWAFWAGYQDQGRRATPWLLFWAFSGVAVLAKGPVGLLPPFVAGLFLLVRREPRFVWQMRPLSGLILLLAIGAPWYVVMSLRNPDYAQYFFVDKIFGSLATEGGAGKSKPFHYYVPVVLGLLLPWTVLLPTALRNAWRSASAESVFLLAWAAGTFIVFSLASAKLGSYMLPLLPALALLIGRALTDLWELPEDAPARSFQVPALLLAGLGLTMLVLALTGLPDRTAEKGVPPQAARGLAVAAALSMALAAWFMAHRRVVACVATTAGLVVALFLTFEIAVAPRMDLYMSSREIGRLADRLLPPGDPVPTFKRVEGIFDAGMFYTGREVRFLEHQRPLRLALRAPEPLLVVVREKDFLRLEERSDIWPMVHLVDQIGDKVLISNRPADEWLADMKPATAHD